MFHFSRGIPPQEAIPSRQLAEHTAAVLRDSEARVFQYAPIGNHTGDAALREQLAAFHSVAADQIFVTNGSLQALDLLAAHLLAGDRKDVYVEAPTYDRAVQIFERHGGRVSGITLQHDGLDLDALEARLATRVPALVYVIPDFQNPSGVTMSEDKRRRLVQLAETHDFLILEDIPYRELRYGGQAPAGFFELAPAGRVLTMGSLSKILSPGLRVGYVIGEPETLGALAALAEGTYLSPAPLLQAVAAQALEAGLAQENVAAIRELLGPRHDGAVKAVRELLGEDALLAVPHGGYYVSVHLPVATDEGTFLKAAAAESLKLTRGSGFYPGDAAPPEGKVFLRLPFQSFEPDEFAAGVERLAAVASKG
ncbi:PLP-dependent aminotransferase family protein [Streptomyces monomycini]|uniref:aminotransferase-like domain-containing protein n=1 Tax=Streptomyces monomycini TaxID=371720 RepID=UPI0004AB474D|nr:PLP-dependent aminotransferase family protein [Streptomyces monomycini]